MEYRELTPDPALAPYIRAVWTLCGSSPTGSVDLVLPDGCAEIVVHRTGRFCEWRAEGDVRRQGSAVVAAVMDRAVALSAAPYFETVGIRFMPYGLARLCDYPLHELSDRIAPAETVLVPAVTRLLSTAAQAGSLDEAVRVLQCGLADVYGRTEVPPATVVDAVRRIRGTGGRLSIDGVVQGTAVNARALERQFARWVGLSPKRYGRVVRFHRAASALISSPELPGAAVAADYGYYDQAHLGRDFKAFTGWAPRAFLAGRLGELTRHFATNPASDSSKTGVPDPRDSHRHGGCS